MSLGNFFYLLSKRLEEKWEISNEHLIATLIHPNLKPFHICPQFKEHAIDLLKQEMLKRQNASSTGTSDAANSLTLSSLTPATASTSNSLSVLQEKNPAEEELQKYLAFAYVIQNKEDDDLLSFWNEHHRSFPLIASVVRNVLAIPTSNTFIERLFSSCKNTVTDKRTKLCFYKRIWTF